MNYFLRRIERDIKNWIYKSSKKKVMNKYKEIKRGRQQRR